MASFDVSSEVDFQEVRNAVDQADREVTNRFDFKATEPQIELTETDITIECSSDDRLAALKQVLEEKLVKRKVSLKALDWDAPADAAGGRARQKAELAAGISSDKARELNKFIKGLGIKGISSQTQGEQLRVNGKKRDQLQEVIAALKAEDFGIPIQTGNFRD
jgi:uncharacterized protein YajQ (UPF0234 family)